MLFDEVFFWSSKKNVSELHRFFFVYSSSRKYVDKYRVTEFRFEENNGRISPEEFF